MGASRQKAGLDPRQDLAEAAEVKAYCRQSARKTMLCASTCAWAG